MRKRIKHESALARLFLSGDYTRVLEKTVDKAGVVSAAPDLPYIIGALTYVGRIDEAGLLFERHFKKLSREGESAARCFLGSALCRKSEYDKAQAHFVTNLRAARESKNLRIRAYAFQGVGFYRYFCGRYANALAAGRKSFQAAVNGDNLYLKFLSSDLMGHALVQTGEISAGLKMLQEALRYSRALGDGEADDAVRISDGVYRASFGLSPSTEIESLKRLYHTLSPQDTYSQSSLLLEIGRQLTLRGRGSESREILNQACRLIYSSGNRRHGVTLNLRYAQNLFLIGEYHQALSLIRSTARELDPRVDKALALQVAGMELKLKRALGLAVPGDSLEETVKRLMLSTGMGVGRRMFDREKGTRNTSLRSLGEDPLGDAVDLARGGQDSLTGILESGYLSLLLDLLPVSRGGHVLYLDLVPDSILLIDGADIELVPRGLSQAIRALVRQLSQGECSKETLIEKVWGYKYDKLRHDPLIYQAVSRLRQLLGERARWIEATENGYRLNSRVTVRFHRIEEEPVARRPQLPTPEEQLASVLNHRQLTLLRQFDRQEFLDVGTCRELFKVSRITATRDLTGLHRLSLVKRIGKGRATRYYSVLGSVNRG